MLKEIVRRRKIVEPIVIKNETSESKDSGGEAVTGLATYGKLRPLVMYYDYIIIDLIFFSIESIGFLPYCVFIFEDKYNLISTLLLPRDIELFKIRVDGQNNSTSSIFIELKMTKIEYVNFQEKKFKVEGYLHLNDFFIKENTSYKNMSSWEVYKIFSEKSGLGFYSNVEGSDDKMTWINPGNYNYTFLQEVIEHAWISPKTTVWSFCDWYYNLVYVDIRKVFEQDYRRSKYRKQKDSLGGTPIFANSTKHESEGETIVLSNHYSEKTSNNYISSYTLINNASEIDHSIGYNRLYGWYDLFPENKNGSEKKGTMYLQALNDITSDGAEKEIYVRNPFVKSQDENMIKNINTLKLSGKINKKNVHKNYFLAEGHNEWNINNCKKIILIVTIETTFLFVYRFQKVYVELFEKVNNNTILMVDISGEWIIYGIKYIWDNEMISTTGKTVLYLIKQNFDK